MYYAANCGKFLTDVSGQPVGLIVDFVTLENGTDALSGDVVKKLPLYAA